MSYIYVWGGGGRPGLVNEAVAPQEFIGAESLPTLPQPLRRGVRPPAPNDGSLPDDWHYGNYGELWGIMGNYGELCGIVGNYVELWGNCGEFGWNYGEIWGIMVELWGIMGNYGELWGNYGELWGIRGNYGGIMAWF